MAWEGGWTSRAGCSCAGRRGCAASRGLRVSHREAREASMSGGPRGGGRGLPPELACSVEATSAPNPPSELAASGEERTWRRRERLRRRADEEASPAIRFLPAREDGAELTGAVAAQGWAATLLSRWASASPPSHAAGRRGGPPRRHRGWSLCWAAQRTGPHVSDASGGTTRHGIEQKECRCGQLEEREEVGWSRGPIGIGGVREKVRCQQTWGV